MSQFDVEWDSDGDGIVDGNIAYTVVDLSDDVETEWKYAACSVWDQNFNIFDKDLQSIRTRCEQHHKGHI